MGRYFLLWCHFGSFDKLRMDLRRGQDDTSTGSGWTFDGLRMTLRSGGGGRPHPRPLSLGERGGRPGRLPRCLIKFLTDIMVGMGYAGWQGVGVMGIGRGGGRPHPRPLSLRERGGRPGRLPRCLTKFLANIMVGMGYAGWQGVGVMGFGRGGGRPHPRPLSLRERGDARDGCRDVLQSSLQILG